MRKMDLSELFWFELYCAIAKTLSNEETAVAPHNVDYLAEAIVKDLKNEIS